MGQQFDHVTIVRPDIFISGGDGVFRYFSGKEERTLLVITQDVLRRLGVMEESLGVRAALEFLDTRINYSNCFSFCDTSL